MILGIFFLSMDKNTQISILRPVSEGKIHFFYSHHIGIQRNLMLPLVESSSDQAEQAGPKNLLAFYFPAISF